MGTPMGTPASTGTSRRHVHSVHTSLLKSGGSVGGVDRAPAVPHFESKWQVEQHLETLSMPWTVLRPVSFIAPTTHLQPIAVDDIGRVAAEAFDHPTEWVGKTVEIAGDDRMAEIAAALGKALGTQVDDAGAMGRLREEGGSRGHRDVQVLRLDGCRRPALLSLLPRRGPAVPSQ
jgi:hypothetical protein